MPFVTVQISRQDFLIRLVGIHCIVDCQIQSGMPGEVLSHGIKVSEVRPGMVETEFSVVRFHGDRTAADNVYRGVEPLTGDDIAEAIAWIAQLPAHMNVNEIVLMPSQQACQYYVHRKS